MPLADVYRTLRFFRTLVEKNIDSSSTATNSYKFVRATHTRSISSFFLGSSNLLLVDFGEIFSESAITDRLFELFPQQTVSLHQLFNVLLLQIQLHRSVADLKVQ